MSSTKAAVLHLPLFIKRLRKQAMAAGVEFLFGEEFDRVKYDGGRIAGIITKSGREIDARLAVDASGIPSVVRRSLNDPFMEGFEIGPGDKFCVLLKYVHLKNQSGKVELSTSWPYYAEGRGDGPVLSRCAESCTRTSCGPKWAPWRTP